MTPTDVTPIQAGDTILYFDEYGKKHQGLVTIVHGVFGTMNDLREKQGWTIEQENELRAKNRARYDLPTEPKDEEDKWHLPLTQEEWDEGGKADMPTPSINLVYVTGDEAKTDPYGRQIERATSVVHKSGQSAHGRYWMNQ
jgi:hypothetical protein